MKKQVNERTYKNDPTPSEVGEYFAAAVNAIREKHQDQIDPKATDWLGQYEAVNDKITLGEIKRHIIARMAEKDEAFSSDYRHEATPEHSFWYRVLGSTVGMNWQIWGLQKQAREVKVNA